MTKNLEDLLDQKTDEFTRRFVDYFDDGSGPVKQVFYEQLDFIKRFADTLLDACEGAVVPAKKHMTDAAREIGWYDCRIEVIENFSTFRTGGEGKRV